MVGVVGGVYDGVGVLDGAPMEVDFDGVTVGV